MQVDHTEPNYAAQKHYTKMELDLLFERSLGSIPATRTVRILHI